jgi:hypothetical protein
MMSGYYAMLLLMTSVCRKIKKQDGGCSSNCKQLTVTSVCRKMLAVCCLTGYLVRFRPEHFRSEQDSILQSCSCLRIKALEASIIFFASHTISCCYTTCTSFAFSCPCLVKCYTRATYNCQTL